MVMVTVSPLVVKAELSRDAALDTAEAGVAFVDEVSPDDTSDDAPDATEDVVEDAAEAVEPAVAEDAVEDAAEEASEDAAPDWLAADDSAAEVG